DNGREGPRIRMMHRLDGRLPLVRRAHDTPLLFALASGGEGRVALQFIGAEFTPKTDVVKDADRLFESFGPLRHDALDERPSADRLHIDFLILMELCACHRRTPYSGPTIAGAY